MFIAHFIADFILQSREMGKRKSSEPLILLAHVSIQWAVMVVVCLVIKYNHWLAFPYWNAVIHGVIDWNIWKLYKWTVVYRTNKEDEECEFLYYEDHLFYVIIGLDQLLHSLTIIILVAYLM